MTTHIDLERWSSDPRKLARDQDFLAADAEHARRAEEARREQEAQAEQDRLAAEARAKLEHELHETIFAMLQAAANLSNHGVHLHEVARIAGIAAARSRFSHDHPLGNSASDFVGWMGEFAQMGAG